MKAIIPVAGIGTRLKPHTHTQPKALMPVAGKPIISHIIDSLSEEGYREFIFIVGYLGDKIESYITQRYPGLQAHFIMQSPREGIGHAVWLARDLAKEEKEILIVLGDTIFEFDLKTLRSEPLSVLGVKKVDDPRNFGVVELNDSGFIKKATEKPNIPTSNLALVGIYKIHEVKMLFDALDYIIKNNLRTHDEFHLTDAIMRMINEGAKMKTFILNNWYDCGSRDHILETNAILLKKMETNAKTDYPFENTVIIPPVSIAENCSIRNSVIGPNVTIGENTSINHGILKDSIIGSFSDIEFAVLAHSLIGSDTTLKGLSQSLNIGDNTEIDFS